MGTANSTRFPHHAVGPRTSSQEGRAERTPVSNVFNTSEQEQEGRPSDGQPDSGSDASRAQTLARVSSVLTTLRNNIRAEQSLFWFDDMAVTSLIADGRFNDEDIVNRLSVHDTAEATLQNLLATGVLRGDAADTSTIEPSMRMDGIFAGAAATPVPEGGGAGDEFSDAADDEPPTQAQEVAFELEPIIRNASVDERYCDGFDRSGFPMFNNTGISYVSNTIIQHLRLDNALDLQEVLYMIIRAALITGRDPSECLLYIVEMHQKHPLLQYGNIGKELLKIVQNDDVEILEALQTAFNMELQSHKQRSANASFSAREAKLRRMSMLNEEAERKDHGLASGTGSGSLPTPPTAGGQKGALSKQLGGASAKEAIFAPGTPVIVLSPDSGTRRHAHVLGHCAATMFAPLTYFIQYGDTNEQAVQPHTRIERSHTQNPTVSLKVPPPPPATSTIALSVYSAVRSSWEESTFTFQWAPCADTADNIIAGRIEIESNNVPQFFTCQPRHRPANSNNGVLTADDYVALLRSLPSSKAGLKAALRITSDEFMKKLDIPAGRGDLYIARRPVYIRDLTMILNLDILSGVSSVAAGEKIRDMLAQSAKLEAYKKYRDVIESEGSIMIFKFSEADKILASIIGRLDSAMLNAVQVSNLKPWNDKCFGIGTDSAASYLTALIALARTVFIESEREERILEKFKYDISSLMADDKLDNGALKMSWDNFIASHTGSMTDLCEQLDNSISCGSVVIHKKERRAPTNWTAPNTNTGQVNAAELNAKFDALRASNAEATAKAVAAAFAGLAIAPAANNATQAAQAAALATAAQQTQAAQAAALAAAAQQTQAAQAAAAMGGAGGFGGNRQMIQLAHGEKFVPGHADIQRMIAEGLLPPDVDVNDLNDLHTRRGTDCAICKTRRQPYLREYNDPLDYKNTHGCWPMMRNGQQPSRPIQPDDVFKHIPSQCRTLWTHLRRAAAADQAMAWLIVPLSDEVGAQRIAESIARAQAQQGG